MLPSGRDFGMHRWNKTRKMMDPRFTENWETLIKTGKSPKEVWEIRFQEVSRINQNFDIKLPYIEYTPPEDNGTAEQNDFAAFEQVGLFFMKPHIREMQSRWERNLDAGKSPEEFWKEERKLFSEGNRNNFGPPWRQWGKRDRHNTDWKWKDRRETFRRHRGYENIRRNPEKSRLFREFDFS